MVRQRTASRRRKAGDEAVDRHDTASEQNPRASTNGGIGGDEGHQPQSPPPPVLQGGPSSSSSRTPVRTLFVLLAFVSAVVVGQKWIDEAAMKMQQDIIPTGILVDEPNRPGLKYKALLEETYNRALPEGPDGLRPVVLIPGFVTTALELWKVDACLQGALTSSFRQRVFSARLLLELVKSPECYLRHFALGPNGSDPTDRIRLRPVEGFDATDYIVPGFWVWAKVLINLADVGLDASHMHMATFDWRLNPEQMEERDGYFTSLKRKFEFLRKKQGKAAVVVVHSYGANVFTAFLRWIAEEHEEGPSWIDKHVHAFFNIGGPLLGLPKALGGLLSGEFRDTARLPIPMKMLLNIHVPLRTRANTFRTWPCLAALLPTFPAAWPQLVTLSDRGGDATEEPGLNRMALNYSESLRALRTSRTGNSHEDLDRVLDSMIAYAQRPRRKTGHTTNSGTGDSRTGTPVEKKERVPPSRESMDEALATNRLPRIGAHRLRMSVYCAHGVEYPTEAGYYYHRQDERDGSAALYGNLDKQKGSSSPQFLVMDTEGTTQGFRESDGDATVPLQSLDYLCHSKLVGWRGLVKDPSQVKIFHVRNHMLQKETAAPLDPRGGEYTGDHVDILGNGEIITQLLHVVSGHDDLTEDRILAEIDTLTEQLDRKLLEHSD